MQSRTWQNKTGGLSFLFTTKKTLWQAKLHTHAISMPCDGFAQVQQLLLTLDPNSTVPASKR